MKDYVITTDNCADLPESYMEENGIGCTYLSYTMDGKVYHYPDFLPEKDFYAKVRDGALPTTAQVNPAQVRALIEPYLKEGKDVLHIAFSSGLSGSCNSAKLAAEELRLRGKIQKSRRGLHGAGPCAGGDGLCARAAVFQHVQRALGADGGAA